MRMTGAASSSTSFHSSQLSDVMPKVAASVGTYRMRKCRPNDTAMATSRYGFDHGGTSSRDASSLSALMALNLRRRERGERSYGGRAGARHGERRTGRPGKLGDTEGTYISMATSTDSERVDALALPDSKYWHGSASKLKVSSPAVYGLGLNPFHVGHSLHVVSCVQLQGHNHHPHKLSVSVRAIQRCESESDDFRRDSGGR
jgi:hypothetical protein